MAVIILFISLSVQSALADPAASSSENPRPKYALDLADNSEFRSCHEDDAIVRAMSNYQIHYQGDDAIDLQQTVDAADEALNLYTRGNSQYLNSFNGTLDASAKTSEQARFNTASIAVDRCIYATGASVTAIKESCLHTYQGSAATKGVYDQMDNLMNQVHELFKYCESHKKFLEELHTKFVAIIDQSIASEGGGSDKLTRSFQPNSVQSPNVEAPAVGNPAPIAPAPMAPVKNESGVGEFLKKNGATIGIAAVAAGGLAMYLNSKDKKSSPASQSAPATTATPTTTTSSENLNAPTTSSTQVQQLSQVPTEQTNPMSASANATANDPAYTGIGSPQGDTSGTRDSSAGTFLTTFGCLEGESTSVCRARLGCNATEAMSACQARWTSGTISVSN